jgi:hypothetical protein
MGSSPTGSPPGSAGGAVTRVACCHISSIGLIGQNGRYRPRRIRPLPTTPFPGSAAFARRVAPQLAHELPDAAAR